MQLNKVVTIVARSIEDAPMKAWFGTAGPSEDIFRTVGIKRTDEGVEMLCCECYENYVLHFKVQETSNEDEYSVEFVKRGESSYDLPVMSGWTQVHPAPCTRVYSRAST